jgi:hypothetical protein
MLERLVHGEVRVRELHVLAHERDLDLALALADALHELLPFGEVGSFVAEPEALADERVEALVAEPDRDEIDVAHVLVHDDRLRVHVGEERDLLADVVRERLVRAAHHDVRVDTDAAELVHGVLRRLRLELPGRPDERDVGHVDVHDVLGPGLAPELADRLEERQRLDVADRPADLGDHDVGVRGRADAPDPVLDLVRDVRDDLHRGAEVLALALAADDGVPDGAGGVVRVPGEVLVDEPLVVADVEIGLGAVFRDEHLSVLERAHRARVDVQVRVELLHLDAKPTRLQEPAERRSRDALAKGRDDAAGDEDVLRRAPSHASRPPLPVSPSRAQTVSASSDGAQPAWCSASAASASAFVRWTVPSGCSGGV